MKEAYKHRLIGAGILAAVAVLFLPSFFKDQQQYAVDTESHIPQRPTITTMEFGEPESPADIEPAPAPETMFIPDESQAVTVPSPAPEPLPEPGGAQVVQTKPSPDNLPEIPLNAQGLPDAWMVQLVSLSSRDAAQKLRDQLQGEGHRAFIRTATTTKGEVHRIFVGPLLDKAEAGRVKQTLDQRLKVNALILPFKP
ncbi:SPOR domain-containing protein [Cellvibrio japonicus]|uniref:Sporulation related repeat family n=1 Tax=Cellvibrio japonicus (strain Ueda107) TaxID=498211 RepID=B3PFP3_CELJU|nr:SPOR domain-containing protein [Cellvibrio japonicus]ACE83146.1 Sporulation related repeat family [Cellvibrio japonicus Ueda107]QEI12268.1 SPOR domain-containing protein [Cellvibrio japonicus]QEI15842.1 SPOR domain-containing protein [Cellvibrio japonicus]QEI19420.1 SPOR domain-containing protein [Cellvibrio japonicus]